MALLMARPGTTSSHPAVPRSVMVKVRCPPHAGSVPRPRHALPLAAQAQHLGISRGSIYYLPRPESDADLAIMRRIDELHLRYPFAVSRMLRDLLRQEGAEVGRLHVATLMKRMRIEAIYRRPNTSKRHPGTMSIPTCCTSCP